MESPADVGRPWQLEECDPAGLHCTDPAGPHCSLGGPQLDRCNRNVFHPQNCPGPGGGALDQPLDLGCRLLLLPLAGCLFKRQHLSLQGCMPAVQVVS